MNLKKILVLSLGLFVIGCSESINDEEIESNITGYVKYQKPIPNYYTTLEFQNDSVDIRFIPKHVNLENVKVRIDKTKSDINSIEILPSKFNRKSFTGRVKVRTDKEVALLISDDNGLPVLSVTGYNFRSGEDLTQNDKYAPGKEVTIEGEIQTLKFDWVGLTDCK